MIFVMYLSWGGGGGGGHCILIKFSVLNLLINSGRFIVLKFKEMEHLDASKIVCF